jgi:hypothetical protein
VSDFNLKEVFGFEKALEAMKKGAAVQRSGWNGKGMYGFIAKPDQLLIPNSLSSKLKGDLRDIPLQDSMCLRSAQETLVVGWRPSQTDLLAEDWSLYYGK